MTATPNDIIDNKTSTVFVDQNGGFYPDMWESKYGSHPKNARKYAYSLRTISKDKDELKKNLIEFENDFLDEFEDNIDDHEKILILVHGYNNSYDEAKQAYDSISHQLTLHSENMEVVEFFWDGLVSEDIFGKFKIWFNASGYSQLAGQFGLRKLLNKIENKEIIIISHSRGASVVLSALSDPPYEKSFAKDTKEYHNLDVSMATPLKDNNNDIKILMLAPAIGDVDFKNHNYYNGHSEYRKFSSQIKEINLTVNEDDKVLKKYFNFLTKKFNPTDVGYEIDTTRRLTENYEIMQIWDFSGQKSHQFLRYIKNPKFIKILNEMDVIK